MQISVTKFVSFLTLRAFGRRKPDDAAGQRPGPGPAVILLLVALGSQSLAAAESSRQPLETIARTAERFLEERTGHGDARISLRAGQLDARLNLPRCGKPLEGFLRRGAEIRSRTVVGVRCNGSTPWKVYVPVDVIVSDKVLVAARTLPGGREPGPDDVRIEQRDVSRLVSGYLSSTDELVGQRLKNQVQAGRVITPAMLKADVVIHRGQSVTLLVSDQSLNIRMAGRALTDGAVNQRIKVENIVSKRVVEGLVRSPEHVEILN